MPSLKPLKSVAHNVCSQFGSTLTYWDGDYGINHLARSTQAAGGEVVVNLLSGTSEPTLVGNGMLSVRELASNLPELLTKAGFNPSILVAATATYRFRGASPDLGGCVAYDCRVELTAVGGRSYVVELSEVNA